MQSVAVKKHRFLFVKVNKAIKRKNFLKQTSALFPYEKKENAFVAAIYSF